MNTEVESRYIVPDRMLFDRLLQIQRLGRYTLDAQGSVRMTDCYLDTRGRALLRQGWACRLRSQDGRWLLTLKGPKTIRGAVVSRLELETALAERIEDPVLWPQGEITEHVKQLTGGLPLRPLMMIKQTRHLFQVCDGPRDVGLLSLDAVRTSADKQQNRSYILECELGATGDLADLQHLDGLLTERFFIIPEPRSKLQRALEWIEQGGSPDELVAARHAPMNVLTLSDRYDVDRTQANYVADLADALYETLAPIHQLPDSCRPLVRIAAFLHNVGITTHRAFRDIVGRDILLRYRLAELDDQEQRVVAAAVAVHRRKVTPERLNEAFPESVFGERRPEALAVAALVRMAAALGASGPQSARIESAALNDRDATITLAGAAAEDAVRRVARRSDVWAMLYGRSPHWVVAEPAETDEAAETVETVEAEPPAKPEAGIGVLPSDTIRQAAGKVLGYHYQRMLDNEAGTLQGDDPEPLHDMRVAVRRLRSALRLFGPFLDADAVTACNDHLRRAGRVLGAVRDMDVAIQEAQRYLKGLPPEAALDLDPLFAAWRARRSRARRRLLRYLRGSAYESLRRQMEELLGQAEDSPQRGARRYTVRRLVPRLIYLDWQMVRAYDAVLESAPVEMLHVLRIDCKRLRYAIEFFRETLPPGLVEMIPQVVGLQDHLGDLHDATVAAGMVDDVLARYDADDEDMAGLRTYRDSRLAEATARLETFPAAWSELMRPRWAKRMNKLVNR
jgi:CHAD domain-containing protein/uncharacterized protein YjbK